MSANASLTIVGGPQRIEPGRETTLTAQVVNLGPVADDFRLSVRDIDPAWVTFRPPMVYLRPNEQATTSITITPPVGVSPQALRPIFRLLSRQAGNVAIVEIAMPSPRPATPQPYAPAREAPTTPQPEPLPQPAPQAAPQMPQVPYLPATRRSSGATPLILGVVAGLILVVVLVGLGALALSRRGTTTTPTATIAIVGEPTAAPAQSAAPTSAPPAIKPSPTTTRAAAKNYVVANTGGDGVYLRRTPNLEDRDTAYVDGTVLTQIGPDVQGGGIAWHNVRTPDGKTGFVPAQYTQDAP